MSSGTSGKTRTLQESFGDGSPPQRNIQVALEVARHRVLVARFFEGPECRAYVDGIRQLYEEDALVYELPANERTEEGE